MGGMIAQKMAIEFPDRVLSLTSMMSSTGEQEYGQSTPEAQQVLFSPRPTDREGYVAAAERELVWASRRYGDPAQLRALAAASYDRSYYPAGVPRQLAAMILDGSRAEALRVPRRADPRHPRPRRHPDRPERRTSEPLSWCPGRGSS